MDKTTTLKPCPFCGGRNAYPVMTPLGYTVECDCGATCLHKDTEGEVIAAWNHRPTEQALLEALKRIVSAFDTQETISEWNSSIVDAEGLLKSLGEAAS